MHGAATMLEVHGGAAGDDSRGSPSGESSGEISWIDVGVDERFASHLRSLGYARPTQIQCASSNPIVSGRNVVMNAETGSGKTLAYAVPALQQLRTLSREEGGFIRREDGCRIICLSPTRELCIQILSVFNALCRHMPWCVTGAVIGGEKRSSEKARLRKGVVVLVGSPGRLLDHLNKTEAFKVGGVGMLVLDEVDRLLDLECWRTVKSLVDILDDRNTAPRSRQTVVCSATIDNDMIPSIDSICRGTDDAVTVCAGGRTGTDAELKDVVIPSSLSLKYLSVESKDRLPILLGLLRHLLHDGGGRSGHGGDADHASQLNPKIVVFVSSRAGSEFLSSILEMNLSSRVSRLHGELPQEMRIKLFVEFVKSRQAAVMVSTDVAARGLDIPGVTTILQYDPPPSVDEFLHRAGRTARNGAPQIADSFQHLFFVFTPFNVPHAYHTRGPRGMRMIVNGSDRRLLFLVSRASRVVVPLNRI